MIQFMEDELHSMIVEATGLDGSKIIFANQNIPRPACPFAEVRISASRAIYTTPETSFGMEGRKILETAKNLFECGVTITVYTKQMAGDRSAQAVCHDMRQYFQMESVQQAACFSFQDIGEVLDTSSLYEVHFESRAIMKLVLHVYSKFTLKHGAIATVEHESVVTNGIDE